jgi:hypothetical protein
MLLKLLSVGQRRLKNRKKRRSPSVCPSVKTYRLAPIDAMLASAAGGRAPDTTPAASCDQLPTAGSKTRRSLRGPAAAEWCYGAGRQAGVAILRPDCEM